MSNNYAFIDGQNLYMSIQEQNWTLKDSKFVNLLRNNYNVIKIFYFIGYVEQNTNLYKDLRRSGYTLVFKKTSKDHNKRTKGNVDTDLAVHTIIKMPHYDKAVVVAGDKDYYFLIKYLIRHNKLLSLIVPSKAKCSRIYKNDRFRNYLAYISRMRNKLE